MRTLALIDSQAATVRQVAETLGSPAAIDGWIRACWKFEDDPPAYEFIRTPALQLQLAENNNGLLRGDCDDAATLAASLLAALGWPADLIAIRIRPDPDYSHVFVRTPIGTGAHTIDIDPIVPASMLPLTGNFEVMTVSV